MQVLLSHHEELDQEHMVRHRNKDHLLMKESSPSNEGGVES